MRFRIKQIDKNIFIAQCKEWYEFSWDSIDKINNYLWLTTPKSHCHNKTYEEALQVIERHKKYLKEKNKYPKYFKV